ncbi:uncharacterized protein LOC119989685 [Tripterygium wilfordii]|uniref:uncharacterized protein LOC119989685 n=1 Tax=Tripterygium wilfordii TaxID=458696 RepID=UPI0018F8535A|nr:uncharacterized protein LOC119989685 [Tripterygium wilfordii]
MSLPTSNPESIQESQNNPVSLESVGNEEGIASEVAGTKTIDANKDNMDKKTRSEVWEHFLKPFRNAAGKLRTRCNYCNNELGAETSAGTSSLRHHVSVCKKYSRPIGPNQFELCLQRSEGGNEEVTSWRFDQRKITKALARMVIVDEYQKNNQTSNHTIMKKIEFNSSSTDLPKLVGFESLPFLWIRLNIKLNTPADPSTQH